MNELTIVAYCADFRKQVVDLAIRAWAPIFPLTRRAVPSFVYDSFWPQGWEVRQAAEVSALLDTQPETVWLAFQGGVLAGFVGISIHPTDQMGEVSIVAVSPDHQRRGIGKALMEFAEQQVRGKGMKMLMVETVDDSGHEAARRTYESRGYERWPVARYFKKL